MTLLHSWTPWIQINPFKKALTRRLGAVFMIRLSLLLRHLSLGAVACLAWSPTPASANPAAQPAHAAAEGVTDEARLKALYAMTIWELLHADGPPAGQMSQIAQRVSESLTQADIDHPARVLSAPERAQLIADYRAMMAGKDEPLELLLVGMLSFSRHFNGFSNSQQTIFEAYRLALAPDKTVDQLVVLGQQQGRIMQMKAKRVEAPAHLTAIAVAQRAHAASQGSYLAIPACPDDQTPQAPRQLQAGMCPALDTLMGDPGWMGATYGSYTFELTEGGFIGTARLDLDGDGVPAVYQVDTEGQPKQLTPDEVF